MLESDSAATKAREHQEYRQKIEEAIEAIKAGTYKNELENEMNSDAVARDWQNTEDDINAFRAEKLQNIQEESEDYVKIFKDLDKEIANAKRKAAMRQERAKARREKANAKADAAIKAAQKDQERHDEATEETKSDL